MPSISDMISLLVTSMMLLSLVKVNIGDDFGICNYVEKIKPGKASVIINMNYPLNYPRGMPCKWLVESDGLMKVSCRHFELPYSQACVLASLMIHDATEDLGLRHCGAGEVNFFSKTNRLLLILTSEVNMPTGRFYCTVQTVASLPSSPSPLSSSTSPSPSAPDDDSSCECGWKNDPRVVGGEVTGEHEYPMMCGLFDKHLSILFCGASIINSKQVITAAHCLKNKRYTQIIVMVGGHDISKVKKMNSTHFFRVASYATHPLYNQSTEDYDIAVMTIEGEMKFNGQVSPVCLPFQHSPDTFGGAIVKVLGWGSTEFAGGPTNILQKTRLSVITNKACSKTYKTVSTRQLCTWGSGRDSCQFDSGGPVLWQNPTSRRVLIIGIISLGSVCADGEPAVNTRIGAFIDWIVEKTPPGIKYCKAE